jgi:hypothetical protein
VFGVWCAQAESMHEVHGHSTVLVHPTSQFGQQATWNIITLETVPTSMRHSSTTMDPIQKAIEDIELREEGASFSYREVAKSVRRKG